MTSENKKIDLSANIIGTNTILAYVCERMARFVEEINKKGGNEILYTALTHIHEHCLEAYQNSIELNNYLGKVYEKGLKKELEELNGQM